MIKGLAPPGHAARVLALLQAAPRRRAAEAVRFRWRFELGEGDEMHFMLLVHARQDGPSATTCRNRSPGVVRSSMISANVVRPNSINHPPLMLASPGHAPVETRQTGMLRKSSGRATSGSKGCKSTHCHATMPPSSSGPQDRRTTFWTSP